MPKQRRASRGGALTFDGLFELLTGTALAAAGYLLLPVPSGAYDWARWAFAPLVVAALLLPLVKGLARRLLPKPLVAHRSAAAGWGWLLLALLVLTLVGAAFVLVWMEVDSSLLSAALDVLLVCLRHVTAALGLALGLTLIFVGYANTQWRVALEGMVWAVGGMLLDAAIWLGVATTATNTLWVPRFLTGWYLLLLGALMALAGLVALICIAIWKGKPSEANPAPEIRGDS